jgi:hypothetical protein
LLGVFDGLVCFVDGGFVGVGEVGGFEGLAAFGSSGFGGARWGRGGGGAGGDEGVWSFEGLGFVVKGSWIGDNLNVVAIVTFIFVAVILVIVDGAGLNH